jgi:superoxide dismutase, Fe-Mn family
MSFDRYKLPDLPYPYEALEPYIDAATMKVHHDGHHKTYVTKLNEVMGEYPDLATPTEELLSSIESLPADIQSGVRQNAGGHANHTLFWTLLSPQKNQKPTEKVAKRIQADCGNFETFREKFSDAAEKHFGSGWTWWCVDANGATKIFSDRDHESPLSKGLTPLLVLDVWEHAYYLKYQNKRPDYIEAFWNVVNWAEVGKRWDEFEKNGATTREWKIAS